MFRKRFLVLSLIIISVIQYVAIGCGKDKFEIIYSIEYTTNGQTKTESSYGGASLSAHYYITKEEYDASPEWQRFDSRSEIGAPSISSVAKKADGKLTYRISAQKTENDDLNRYTKVYRDIMGGYQYLKYSIIGYSYTFIYVKVINDSTIVIRNTRGDTTYKVSSYRITRFK